MKQLKSYIPEPQQFQKKQRSDGRIFFEDLAVVDGATRAVLAHRGEAFEVEGVGCLALLDKTLWAWVTSPFGVKTRLLTGAGEGSLLAFADLLSLTGLLLCAYLPARPECVAFALKRMGREDVLYAPGITPCTSAAFGEDESLFEDLQELLYYADRVLCVKKAVGLWTSCVTVANLAGCRLEQVAMPPSLPTIKPLDVARLHLFLLCSFLTLRGKDGRVLAVSSEDPSLPLCRCSVEFLEGVTARQCFLDGEEREKQDPVDGSFLSVPCFAGFEMLEGEEGACLCAELPIASDPADLRARSDLWILRLTLERQSA